jgi:competence protein ComEC
MRAWFDGFCGRHPLFAAAMVAAGSVAAANVGTVWGMVAGLALAAVGGWMGGWKRGLGWALCGSLALAVFAWRDGARKEAEEVLADAPGGFVRASVLKDARGSERFWSAPVRLLDGGNARVTVWWEGRGRMPVAGSRVAASGQFGPIPATRNEGEFDRAAWLRMRGVAAVFHTSRDDGTVETGALAELGAKLRHGFRAWVTDGLDEASLEAGVIRAVVIGEAPPDSEELIAAFRNSGTLHAFSVSGLHVAMVGSIGWVVLGFLGVPRRWAVCLLLPLIFGYSWITGNSPPAVRSAWMAAVFLGAFVFRRKPDLLNALGAVLLAAMCWDGRLLFQPGVQLSYGVVAAIAVGTAWAARTFAWMAEPELYLPEKRMNRLERCWLWLRRKTAQSLSVSLAAGVGSSPLTAFHFGLLTPVSVLAGLVLVPLVYILLAAAMLAVCLHPVAAPVSRWVNRLNGHVAKVSVLAAEGFSAIPGGHFQVGREKQTTLRIYDLEHGAGAACFHDGAGAVLLDCGDRRGFNQIVAPSLRRLGITPDSVVLSHPDGNHLGGGPQVWEAFPIKQALMPVRLARSPSYRAWMNDGPKAGIRLLEASAVSSLAMPDGARLEILHAPNPLARDALADDRLAIYRLHWHGWKLLLTSDAGMGAEMKLLDAAKDIAADVIIAGRHRSDLTLCDRFLNAVDPQAIIASNPPFPPAEKLPESTAAYWKSRGIRVLDQARTGGVTLRVDAAGNLSIQGFLSDASVILKRR